MTPCIRSRGYLPHWEIDHATYFVTFRLADSLPQELLTRLRQERDALDRSRSAAFQAASSSEKSNAGETPALQADQNQNRARKLRAILQKAEQCLDDGLGQCYMRDFRIAKIVAGTIPPFHRQPHPPPGRGLMPHPLPATFSPLA